MQRATMHMYRLALIVKDGTAQRFTVLLSPCPCPADDGDTPLWDLPSSLFSAASQQAPVSDCPFTSAVNETLSNIGLPCHNAGDAVSQLKLQLLSTWEYMQTWIYWKFVEQPDFGCGPSVHSILFMTELKADGLSIPGKWFNSEDAWATLMIGGKQMDLRVGPLAAYAFSPHFPEGIQNRLKLDVKSQEYPPGVFVLPQTSWTLKPFSKTNLVVFLSKIAVEQRTGLSLHGDALIVDPGCHPRDAQELLSKIVRLLPEKLFVFLTHHHLDHTEGLPSVYKENPKAIVLGHELTIQRIKKVVGKLQCLPVADGAMVHIGNEEIKVIAAPGHTDGHMALLHVPSHTLIVGDHCVGQGSSVLDAKSGGNMQDYLTTTKNFIGLAPSVIVPMHGPTTLWPLQMLKGYIRHREAREAKILRCINEGAQTAFEIISGAYSDTSSAYWPAALSNVRLHVDHLDAKQQLPQEFSIATFRNSCGIRFFLRCWGNSSFTWPRAATHNRAAVFKVPIIIAALGCLWFLTDKKLCSH